MLELLSNFRVQDAIDIAIIAFVIYRIIDLIRGTRAVQMLIGLALLVWGLAQATPKTLWPVGKQESDSAPAPRATESQP